MPGVGFVVIQTSRPFPVFYLAYGVTAGSETEFRARDDEQCKRLLLVCVGGVLICGWRNQFTRFVRHLRVLAGNREIVRIPRRTKDFHHELVQTR